MTGLFPAQRAAEEFDEVLGGTAATAVAARYSELLDTVDVLRAQPAVHPRAGFSAALRERLMTAAATELHFVLHAVGSTTPQSAPLITPSRHRRRLGSLAAALVMVGGTAGMAAAAGGALPGEALYPVKRSIEQAEIAVQPGEVSKGEALLGQADTRLDEVSALTAEGTTDPDLYDATVSSFRNAAESGSARLFTAYRSDQDSAHVEAVRAFTSKQMKKIADLSTGADLSTTRLLVDAADTVSDIESQARMLCGSCGSSTAVAPPASLSAAAGAAAIDSLLAQPVSQAQMDVAAADAQRLSRLRHQTQAAERSAGRPARGAKGTVVAVVAGRTVPTNGDSPATSQITKDGNLVPARTSSTAVRDLVKGVTGTVRGVTGSAPSGPEIGETPLVKTGSGLDGSVDSLVP